MKSFRAIKVPGRGRTRDMALREQIIQVAGQLLLEVGFLRFTIEGVAARAHASKVTIYKWWPSKGALALDGYVAVVSESLDFPRTRSARADVEAQLAAQIHRLTQTTAGRAITELIGAAQQDPILKAELATRYILPRRDLGANSFARLLRLDQENDREKINLVLDQVYGAIYNRLLFGLQPLNRNFAHDLVAMIVEAVRSRDRNTLKRPGQNASNSSKRLPKSNR